MMTVQSGWESYYNDLLKPMGVVPGTIQYKETRRAFYAGSQHFFCMTMKAADLSEEAGEAILETLDEELQGFIAGISGGTQGN